MVRRFAAGHRAVGRSGTTSPPARSPRRPPAAGAAVNRCGDLCLVAGRRAPRGCYAAPPPAHDAKLPDRPVFRADAASSTGRGLRRYSSSQLPFRDKQRSGVVQQRGAGDKDCQRDERLRFRQFPAVPCRAPPSAPVQSWLRQRKWNFKGVRVQHDDEQVVLDARRRRLPGGEQHCSQRDADVQLDVARRRGSPAHITSLMPYPPPACR